MICSKKKKQISAGAIPKDAKSAKESNCLPISEVVFNNLAKTPSKKSKNAPTKIKRKAKLNECLDAKTTAIQPETRFIKVTIFGMFFFILFIIVAI